MLIDKESNAMNMLSKDLLSTRICKKNILGREPNFRILQRNVALQSGRYTAEWLYIECLNIA